MSGFINDVIEGAGLVMQVTEVRQNIFACTITRSQKLDYDWKRNITTKPGFGAPTIGNVLYHYALRAQDVS